MEFGLFGPLVVRRDGRELPLGGPKQRAVLAILLLRRGATVPADVLVDEIWGETAPPTARNALQGYVFQLRKTLEPDVARGEPHRVLVSDGAGYRLVAADDEVDARRFELLLAEARPLVRVSPARAVALLDEALDLWRGPPLADLAFEQFAQPEIQRLEELRLAAEEVRFEALLADGRHADVVGELEAAVARHPTRERLQEHLLLALYRSGRQADALEAYARAREHLLEQLGVDPGEDLKRLHLAILNQDAALAAPEPRAPIVLRPLPRPPTALVGRDLVVAELAELVREHRIVTLLGPGGVGKTRLAQAVAAEAGAAFPDGVGWVALETLTDPREVVPEIAAAGALSDPIADLADRRVLLVLDNLEQVIESAAVLAQLVAATEGVHLLVTSREPLDVAAERRYHVPSLDPEHALTLFSARVQAVGASLDDGDDSARRICERLEGLPLALELAAAQTATLSPAELLDRLELTDALAGGRRDAPERHRSLRAAIEWSHRLLDGDEADAYARLSVFSGGWTLEAAEHVADVKAGTLAALVAKSLVRRDGGRFSMLETLRQDATERLEGRGEADALKRAHAHWFLAVAEREAADLGGPEHAEATARLEADEPNLRAAIGVLLETDPTDALRLAAALQSFWLMRGRLELARESVEAALARAGDERTVERAAVLRNLAFLAGKQGDYEGAERFGEKALSFARGSGHDQEAAASLNVLAGIAMDRGDFERSGALYEEALALARRLRDDELVARSLTNLGILAALGGELERSMALSEEARALCHSLGNVAAEANALMNLGTAAAESGDAARAWSALLGALALYRQLGNRLGAAGCLESLAEAALGSGAPEQAVRLWGAAAAAHEQAGAVAMPPAEIEQYERLLQHARAEIGEERFAAAWAAGSALLLEDAVDECLADAAAPARDRVSRP